MYRVLFLPLCREREIGRERERARERESEREKERKKENTRQREREREPQRHGYVSDTECLSFHGVHTRTPDDSIQSFIWDEGASEDRSAGTFHLNLLSRSRQSGVSG